MLSKVLVANRGEIAARIIRTCAELGIATVAVHSEPDKNALHVRLADEAIALAGDRAGETYLNQQALIEACRASGADAIHPGYGFLAENATFAALVEENGLIFIGPSSAAIGQLGDKVRARALAIAAGVPVVPGSKCRVNTMQDVLGFGADHGWPVAIKAVHGGGGRGMRVVHSDDDVGGLLESAKAEAKGAFGNDEMYLERYLDRARHVEVQIFADRFGNTVWLGDRDCSVQRLHQKLIEEAPAPDLSDELRRQMGEASVRLARQVSYVGAGTVEYLVHDGEFFFLEVNTRIQVEHPVTEMVLGVDLVREQLLVAGGAKIAWQSGAAPRGHAIECRVNAEDPSKGFHPKPGRIELLQLPWRPGIRFDFGYESGDTVPPFYDSLVGKVIAWAPSRELALTRLAEALEAMVITGVPTTIPVVCQALKHGEMRAGPVHTRWLEAHLDDLVTAIPMRDNKDDKVVSAKPKYVPTEVWIGNRRYLIPPAPPRMDGQPAGRRSSSAAVQGRRAELGQSGGKVVSPIHGVVLDIAVHVGQKVSEGERLLTVEAMKMENIVSAPCAGVVDDVLVAVKSSVAADQHLITINPSVPVA
jgi:acetyl-CoA/propionyl-CoA carboxylase, biotin carboxylase, biotin carboxyl carrier protein